MLRLSLLEMKNLLLGEALKNSSFLKVMQDPFLRQSLQLQPTKPKARHLAYLGTSGCAASPPVTGKKATLFLKCWQDGKGWWDAVSELLSKKKPTSTIPPNTQQTLRLRMQKPGMVYLHTSNPVGCDLNAEFLKPSSHFLQKQWNMQGTSNRSRYLMAWTLPYIPSFKRSFLVYGKIGH